MQVKFAAGFILFCLIGCQPPPPKSIPEQISVEDLTASETDPRRLASLRLTAECAKELQASHFERAAHRCSSAIEVDPANPYAYFYLGRTRFKTARYEQAADLFGRASSLFGEEKNWSAEALAYRGESFEQLRRKDKALKSFDEALEIDRTNGRAQAGLDRLEKKPE